MNHPRCLPPTLVLALLAAALPAQGGDPMREIQEIARQVDEQLQEIDRLLLESSKRNQARSTPKELLQQARERSQVAEDGIDKLIEKLNQMKNSGGGGGSSDDPQQQQQQQQQDQQDQQQQQQQGQQQGQRNRRENQTPDLVPRPQGEQGQQPEPGGQQPQPQPGQGQPQPQPQQQGNPQGGQETQDPGQNTRGNNQPESPTGPGTPGTGDGNWGELQPYMNFLRNRGSNPPQVPEKFRKYWEAYLKSDQGQAPRKPK